MLSCKTLPELLLESYQSFTSTASFSIPHKGLTQTESIKDFYPSICHLSSALLDLGIKKGDCVALMSSGSPDWIRCDVAIQMCGAITVPLFPQLSKEIFEFEIKDSNAKAIICLDPLGYDLIAEHSNYFKIIIQKETSNILEKSTSLTTILSDKFNKEDVIRKGSQNINKINRDDLATIIYTSGSTGMPKGVELTHKNLIFEIEGARQRFPLDPTSDIALSCLPLAHIFEKMVMYFYISSGVPIHFVDDINNIADCLKKIKPTVITLVPRLLEKVFSKIRHKVNDASLPQKMIGKWALSMAQKNDFSITTPLLQPLAKKIVYKKLKLIFGGKVKFAIVGGAALNKDLNIFFNNIGIPVYQGYGLTETSPVICANYPNHNKPGTVGKTFPNVEIKVDKESKEIMTKGQHTMGCYHNNNEATSDILKNEWLHTGDCGYLDEDGYLTINGRIKEMFKTSNGKYVSPTPIEQSICKHPLIDMAMVIAESKKFCSCLLFIDTTYLQSYKNKFLSTLSDHDFLESSIVEKRIAKHIKACNKSLNHWESIQKFRIITSPLSIENGELTPTMKIKRHFVSKKYEQLINSMYNDTLK